MPDWKCKCSLRVSVTLLHYLCSSWFQGTFKQTKSINSRRKKIAVAKATSDDSSWVASSKSCEAAVIFQMLNPALASLFLPLTASNPPLPFFARRPTQPAAVRDAESSLSWCLPRMVSQKCVWVMQMSCWTDWTVAPEGSKNRTVNCLAIKIPRCVVGFPQFISERLVLHTLYLQLCYY